MIMDVAMLMYLVLVE